ncbi:DUF5391 family protein [Cytobacillus horneckiae]|uniref:DUF5391 family protein n=1 Tax=Cytobacillus horneckiae TaxID=549687 RepID=UPI003D9A337D
MWISILFNSVVLYMIGIEWMKYAMAVLCRIGTLVFLSAFGIVMVIGWLNEMSGLTSVWVICGLGTITNIIWFFSSQLISLFYYEN